MSLASTFLVSCSSDGEYSFRSPDEYHKDRDGGGLWVDQNAVKFAMVVFMLCKLHSFL